MALVSCATKSGDPASGATHLSGQVRQPGCLDRCHLLGAERPGFLGVNCLMRRAPCPFSPPLC